MSIQNSRVPRSQGLSSTILVIFGNFTDHQLRSYTKCFTFFALGAGRGETLGTRLAPCHLSTTMYYIYDHWVSSKSLRLHHTL